MNNKYLILSTILALTVTLAFGQDTSGNHLKSNQEIINSNIDPNAGSPSADPSSNAPHSVISPNTGTDIPSTTSGTLNSTVNPSTELVIPLHKSKRNSNAGVATGNKNLNRTDSSVIIPKN